MDSSRDRESVLRRRREHYRLQRERETPEEREVRWWRCADCTGIIHITPWSGFFFSCPALLDLILIGSPMALGNHILQA